MSSGNFLEGGFCHGIVSSGSSGESDVSSAFSHLSWTSSRVLRTWTTSAMVARLFADPWAGLCCRSR
jgi:hypothetical protein